METTFDVRIYKTDVWVSKRKGGKTTYWVRWRVGKKHFKLPYGTAALAASFRSQLMSAAGKGKAFRLDDGLPVSMARAAKTMGRYEFACVFVDMKWPHVAATTRRTHAEALTTATAALFANERGKPDDKLIRRALCRWGFNTNKRGDPDMPTDVRNTLQWVFDHCRQVSAVKNPEVLRHLLNSLTSSWTESPPPRA